MDAIQRRRYSRIRFREAAIFQAGAGQWPCKVLDLSLRGALIAIGAPNIAMNIAIGTACLLELRLDDEICVRMDGHVAHRYGNQIGVVCDETDLDSIAHLRRMLALNLGDTSLLEREFSMLLATHEAHSL